MSSSARAWQSRPSTSSARWSAPTAPSGGGPRPERSRRRAPGGSPPIPEWPLAGWMVRGDEALASGDTFAALGAYLHAAELAPDDAGIAREVSGILVRLRRAVRRRAAVTDA